MKKLLVSLVALTVLFATPAHAETVRTCSSVYGGGEVCGETTANTTTTVEHTTVAAGANDLELWQIIGIVGSVAAVSTLLYKLSYRWYILG